MGADFGMRIKSDMLHLGDVAVAVVVVFVGADDDDDAVVEAEGDPV